MSLKKRDVDSHKNGAAEYGIVVAPCGKIAAVLVAEDVLPVEHIGDPKIENEKMFLKGKIFAAVDVHA